MNQAERNNYWKQLAMSHVTVAHDATVSDGKRNSFLFDIADDLDASEFVRLHFPCVAVGLVTGRISNSDGHYRARFQNTLYFLTQFSVESNANPSIPASKEAAFETTYDVMNDFINKVLSDYIDNGPCGAFKYIDENSFRWEDVDLAGANMCGWALYFNDEEPVHFSIDESKWN